jgi:hypothetical protein
VNESRSVTMTISFLCTAEWTASGLRSRTFAVPLIFDENSDPFLGAYEYLHAVRDGVTIRSTARLGFSRSGRSPGQA